MPDLSLMQLQKYIRSALFNYKIHFLLKLFQLQSIIAAFHILMFQLKNYFSLSDLTKKWVCFWPVPFITLLCIPPVPVTKLLLHSLFQLKIYYNIWYFYVPFTKLFCTPWSSYKINFGLHLFRLQNFFCILSVPATKLLSHSLFQLKIYYFIWYSYVPLTTLFCTPSFTYIILFCTSPFPVTKLLLYPTYSSYKITFVLPVPTAKLVLHLICTCSIYKNRFVCPDLITKIHLKTWRWQLAWGPIFRNSVFKDFN